MLVVDRQTEVCHQRTSVCVEQNVGRLKISMNDVRMVSMGQGFGDTDRQLACIPPINRAIFHRHVERISLDQLHRDEGHTGLNFTAAENRHDSRMDDLCSSLGLLQKQLGLIDLVLIERFRNL